MAQDCGYTGWASWGACTTTCGPGIQERYRNDSNPPAAYGGKACDEAISQYQACQVSLCPGKTIIIYPAYQSGIKMRFFLPTTITTNKGFLILFAIKSLIYCLIFKIIYDN